MSCLHCKNSSVQGCLRVAINITVGGTSGKKRKKKENPSDNTDRIDTGLIPGLGRSPGLGNGNPLQHSSLENSMDRGAWQATVHAVAKSWTRERQGQG